MVMDFWCLRGPISAVPHPVFLFPSGTIQKSKCGRLIAQMLQWKNVGEPDVRGTSPEWRICNRESQHMLERAGLLTKLWICSMVLAHIQVKMPVQIKRQNCPVIISVLYWVSLKKKESFGGEGLIDPRPDTWTWISTTTSEEKNSAILNPGIT